MYWTMINDGDNFQSIEFIVRTGKILIQSVKGDHSLEKAEIDLSNIYIPVDKITTLVSKIFSLPTALPN